MAIEIEKVTTNEFEMRYFKFGAGERTAVILPGLSVKSVMGSADGVAASYRAMKNDYTIYVFDRRTVCPEDYTTDAMAEDTAAAFAALGLRNVYLFGVSQGGMIAQLVALNHPELVRKLVLCSTIARITEGNSRVIRNWLEYAERGDKEALNKSIIGAVYSAAFREKFGGLLLGFMSGATDEELKRFIILAKGCRDFDVYDRLGELECPVLVVGSRSDAVFDYNCIAEVAEKSGARMITYENYGHAVYDETPDCLKKVIEFFNSDTE